MTIRTAGQEFYQRQIDAVEARDLDRIVAQYTPDARIVGFDFQVQGSAEIRAHFTAYMARLGDIKLKSTEQFAENEGSIFFEATIDVSAGEARVYDVFVLDGEKASHHFTGTLGFTPTPSSEPALVSG